MLSKRRKQLRDGVVKGKLPLLDLVAVGELQRLRELEQKWTRAASSIGTANFEIGHAQDRREPQDPPA